MAENKRTDFQIESDRTLIADLYCKGYTQQEITNEINARYEKQVKSTNQVPITLSRQMIGIDIQAIIDEWQTERVEDISKIKAVQIKKIDLIYREAFKAWYKSIGDHEKLKIKTGSNDKGSYSEETSEEEYIPGDPRFLKLAIEAIDKVSRITGLYSEDNSKDKTKDIVRVVYSIPNNGRRKDIAQGI